MVALRSVTFPIKFLNIVVIIVLFFLVFVLLLVFLVRTVSPIKIILIVVLVTLRKIDQVFGGRVLLMALDFSQQGLDVVVCFLAPHVLPKL